MTTRQTKADKDAAAAAIAATEEPEQRVAARAEWEAAGATPEEAEVLVDLTADELAALAPPPAEGGDPDAPDPSPDVELDTTAPADGTIPVHRDGELVPAEAESSQPIDLEGQRVRLDELRESLASLDPEDVGRAIDEARADAETSDELEPSVYLIHPSKGHVVHVTLTQAVAMDALGWADATLDDIRRAGLTR